MLQFARDLERGDRKARLHLYSGKEFIEIAKLLNDFLDKRSAQIKFLKTIGEGGARSSYDPDRADILGNEIKVMAERLNRSQKEVLKRQEEDRKRNWAAEGIARFSEVLRTEREDLQALSFRVIKELVTYLQIEMGILFLSGEGKDGEKYLEATAGYAYDRRKYIHKKFLFGEGLPGTCAIEKEKIYINDIPEDYSNVVSGVGQARPRNALLVPMMLHEEVFGVIELASFRKLEPHEIKFVDQIAETIVSGLQIVKKEQNEKS